MCKEEYLDCCGHLVGCLAFPHQKLGSAPLELQSDCKTAACCRDLDHALTKKMHDTLQATRHFKHLANCRTMTLGMLTIAISTGSLIFSMAHSTVQLFASRAASMGAFTVLYIYTPEVRPQAGLGTCSSRTQIS